MSVEKQPLQWSQPVRMWWMNRTRRQLGPLSVLVSLVALAPLPLFAEPNVDIDTTKGKVGTQAIPFTFDRLSGGKVSLKSLRGKTTVLVAGRTRKSAPRCKEWVLKLYDRHRDAVHIYDIVVADKAWYLPGAFVRNHLSDFVPKEHHHRILIDWGKEFAKKYGIVKDDLPSIFLVDAHGVIVWRFKGLVNNQTLVEIGKKIAELQGNAPLPETVSKR